jgi:hypothetical protein
MARVFWSPFGLSTFGLVFSDSEEFCRFTETRKPIITVSMLVALFRFRSSQFAFDLNAGHSFCNEGFEFGSNSHERYIEHFVN